MHRTFVSVALILLWFVAETVTATPQHAKYGISLPFPIVLEQSSPRDSLLVGRPELAHDLWLTVSASGKVTAVRSSRVMSAEFQSRLLRWLSHTTFEPGRVKGNAKAMQLPASLYLSPVDSTATLVFPIDSAGRICDYGLHARALTAQGIRLPFVEYFPWYHATFPQSDTSRALRYVLITTVLGKSARPTLVELAATNFAAFADQLVSAANYGKFRAGGLAKPPRLDTVFVLITFFPTTKYPTSAWVAARQDSLDVQDRLAVRLLVDTAGTIMIPPLPKARREAVLSLKYPTERAATVIPIEVDSSGMVTQQIDSLRAPAASTYARILISQLAFYPALDFSGHTVRFRGFLEVEPNNESSVRIRYCWLQPDLSTMSR